MVHLRKKRVNNLNVSLPHCNIGILLNAIRLWWLMDETSSNGYDNSIFIVEPCCLPWEYHYKKYAAAA